MQIVYDLYVVIMNWANPLKISSHLDTALAFVIVGYFFALVPPPMHRYFIASLHHN